MTRKRTLSAALATTASVALLAGLSPAQAQMAGSPGGPCSTTLESPAYNNCTLPSSSAPGAGSFPGSFLVPGTSTSFAVHGILWFQAEHEFGPNSTEGGLTNNTALQGPGASATQLGQHANNGGTDMTVAPTRPNIETRTPTAYGELKTYIEMDFALAGNGSSTVYGGSAGPYYPSSASNQPAGNEDSMRLRQAYATLGPWLMGQTKTLVDDVQAYPDLADAGLDAGRRTSTNVHKPQVRYTWLAGNGISVAGSIEQPTHDVQGTFTTTGGAVTAWTEDNNGIIPGASTISIPDVGLSGQWDQPWGHVRLTGMYHDAKIQNGSPTQSALTANTTSGAITSAAASQANPFTPGQTGYRTENPGYTFILSGHVNTFGKDRLTGIVQYASGFSDADGPYNAYDYILGPSGIRKAEKAWNFDASYEHFFTSQWRANVSGGLIHFTTGGLPAGNTTAESGMPFLAWTAHANVIFSPVPQTDFITEYEHGTYTTYSGLGTREDRLTQQFKFYF